MDERAANEEAERRIAFARRKRSTGLDLPGLGLRELPLSLNSLPWLEVLYVSGNRLESLPDWIGDFGRLRSLTLHDNPLRSIPPTIGRLQQLERLIIDGGTAAAARRELADLKNLRELALGNLGLRRIPEWLADMSGLRVLWLHGNPLGALPHWLGRLRGLQSLTVSATGIETLPAELRDLPSLAHLDVRDNPRLGIPPEIVGSTDAGRILDYYFRIRGDADGQPLNEFKLVLVGRGGVGKTSLVHRLVKDEYRTFKRTPGIKITRWAVPVDRTSVQAHVWDFGGQEIMHGTHRFFMTERAVYLVLVSGREGSEDTDADYWLALVRSFAGDVPVIVLLHKWDEHRFQLNRGQLRDRYGELVFVETDSASGHGIDELRRRIAEQAGALPGLRAAWPGAWRRVKDELTRRRKKWLTFDEFRDYCRDRDVLDSDDQERLAEALHDLGLMLAYRRDPALRGFGVLDPQWATRGIYAMLNAQSLQDAGGKLTLADFAEVLSARDYPAELHPYLLALMLKFDLCHPLDQRRTRFLIPELLGKEQPDVDVDFPPDRCLSFVYRYAPVLPEGLLPRFIVASYVHREPRLAWRTGAVLERGNCRALVRGDPHERTVTIRVTGPGSGRRELLGVVREHFERIHRSYEKMVVSEVVPVPGHPEVSLDYDELLVYEREFEETIKVRVGRQLFDFSVRELLDGVDLPGTRGRPGGAGVATVSADGGIRWRLEYEPLPVFISYARKDATFLDELRAALILHERAGEIAVWYDSLTEPGQEWEPEILGRLERAGLVILLLSSDFARSSYCMDKELPRALERRAHGECEIVPIVIREARFDKLALGDIQAIRPGGKAVKNRRDRDRAWTEVTRELDRVIAKLRSRPST